MNRPFLYDKDRGGYGPIAPSPPLSNPLLI